MFFCQMSVWADSCALSRTGKINLKPVTSSSLELETQVRKNHLCVSGGSEQGLHLHIELRSCGPGFTQSLHSGSLVTGT